MVFPKQRLPHIIAAIYTRRAVTSTVMAYRSPKDLADRMAARRRRTEAGDGFARETFTLPREQARERARGYLTRWPTAAYLSTVESWHELPGEEIEFTMRRLTSAD